MMDSFFQRVSSLVRRNSQKLFEQEIDDEEEQNQQRQFHHLAGRRRSAPDIHRHVPAINRLIRTPAHKGTSDEQIASHSHTNFLPRKNYTSTGKFLQPFD